MLKHHQMQQAIIVTFDEAQNKLHPNQAGYSSGEKEKHAPTNHCKTAIALAAVFGITSFIVLAAFGAYFYFRNERPAWC